MYTERTSGERGSRMRVLRAYVALVHPWAVLIVMLATALFGLLAVGGEPNWQRYLLLLGGMLGGQISIGALNEYQDRALDALSKPERPIPSGLVSSAGALRLAAAGLLLMGAAGGALGLGALALLVLGTGAGIAYDLWLKATRWSWLPYLLALPLLPSWVWLALGRPQPLLLLLYPLGAPMVLAVHLAQSLGDTESDREAGIGSLGARLGRARTLAVLLGAGLLAAALVALFALVLGGREAPALIAAGLTVACLAGALSLEPVAPHLLDRHLFKLLTSLAVALGIGWVLAAGL